MDYRAFLESKIVVAPSTGFEVDPADINPALKPFAQDIVAWALRGGRRAVFASFGLHKCHGRGTPILLADGSIKPVEDIAVGDVLMGDDGSPRPVRELHRGREEMFRIRLRNGDSYICNASHILSLKVSNRYGAFKQGDIVDMPLRAYLALPAYVQRNCFKHYKVAIDFPSQAVPFDPYLYGAWLGDGMVRSLAWCINDQDQEIVARLRSFATDRGLSIREVKGRGCTNYHLVRRVKGRARHVDEFYFVKQSAATGVKRIDRQYLLNDRATRLQLLAGLIDTDGHLIDKCFNISSKWEGLRDDIVFLARSLGLSVSQAEAIVNDRTYYVIYISGHTDMVPCLTRKKAGPRKQIKNPLVYGFQAESLGEGDYFGFEIGNNHRYLLGDFTVTHNTSIQLEFGRLVRKHLDAPFLTVLPLGVRQEFAREVADRGFDKLGVRLKFIRSEAEVERGDPNVHHLTNYETIRDGKLDPRIFGGVTLDESDVLRSYGSKTYQTFLPLFAGIPFKMPATATPDPNRVKELIHYAGFLEVMDTGQALTRFFQRNSEKANELTLYPHKEEEFWLWVSSWAVMVQKPSDLGYPDDGYVLPPLDVQWHEVPSDHSKAEPERDGQGVMFRDPARGLTEAAAEKRDSLPARVAKMVEIIERDPAQHRILWHHLEAERHAIQKARPQSLAVWGSQDLAERERRVIGFANGEFAEISTKPEICGAGPNWQQHCHEMIFVGLDYKFRDIIQAIHRTLRFGQVQACTAHFIYTEAERAIRADVERKWAEHDAQRARMSEIIRKYGLGKVDLALALKRTIGMSRQEARGERYTIANNDAVDEARRQPENSIGLIVTSIPFANHYEYTDKYEDFGHTKDNDHFWAQMDYLTPELLRILQPGRLACVHVKDRILFGSVTGAGLPTVSPFHAEAIFHYRRHGFDYCGEITIVTDVVRENNGTYRLGYSEMCRDGTKMGVGGPEKLLLFHKPQSDRSRGFANIPVVKDKEQYSLARWQLDAHAFWRSSGNTLLTPEEFAARLRNLGMEQVTRIFKNFSLAEIYDHEYVVRLGEALGDRLPREFMGIAPGSPHPDVWTDVTRMLTLNSEQSARRVEKHICPLQFEIVDRAIARYSNSDDLVYDPFAGIGTVPYRAILAGRRGGGSELNPQSYRDAVHYIKAAENKIAVPSMFDLIEPGALVA